MKIIQEVNPFRCRMWDLHDRIDAYVTEESCRAEIQSIEKHGQMVPVLARPLRRDPDHDYELIFGARRLFASRHLNRRLTIEVRELTDREALIAMDIENRHRKDISPYERGMSYSRWLRTGQFKSQEDIALSLGVSASQVSRLLKVARLPSAIVAAFESATEICEGWGLDLVEAVNDHERRAATLARARAIASKHPRPPAAEIYRELIMAAPKGRKLRPSSHDLVVTGANRSQLFRVRFQRRSIALLLPAAKISAKSFERIRDAVAQILEAEGECPVQPVSIEIMDGIAQG